MNYIDIISKQVEELDKVVIAIDGPSASGKTTLGKILSKKYNAVLIHTDDYFLPKHRKTSERLSESGGNLDYERLEKEVMSNLNSNEITSNSFNCFTEELELKPSIKNKQVIIIEGAYSMHEKLRAYYTLSLFITIDKKKQLDRIRKRNGEIMLKRWINEWIPLEDYYFNEDDVKSKVDFVIDSEDFTKA